MSASELKDKTILLHYKQKIVLRIFVSHSPSNFSFLSAFLKSIFSRGFFKSFHYLY